MNLAFLWRFVLATLITITAFSFSDAFEFRSLYSALMVAVIIGLGNALTPHLLPLLYLSVNLVSVLLFAFGFTLALCILLGSVLANFDVVSVPAALVPAAVIAIVVWFGTLTFGGVRI